MGKLVIFGSSGHAKVVIDILEKEGQHEIVGLIDPCREAGEEILGYPVLGTETDLPDLVTELSINHCIIAVGDNYQRGIYAKKITKLAPGLPFASAIHPRANIARDVSIGQGTVIAAGVTVGPCCSIGNFCILNTNSSLDHDSVMEEFASLAPKVSTGGNVHIGICTALGIGAAVIHGVTIGEHTVIGAGAMVVRDVGGFAVAVGVPSRVIRERSAGEKYL